MKQYLPDLSEIKFTASRSRGPGGQNVNKVSSAALLNWSYLDSKSFNDEEKSLITTKHLDLLRSRSRNSSLRM